jgi:hypothetical protein
MFGLIVGVEHRRLGRFTLALAQRPEPNTLPGLIGLGSCDVGVLLRQQNLAENVVCPTLITLKQRRSGDFKNAMIKCQKFLVGCQMSFYVT